MQKKVCVIGLGHVGLPTACVLADSIYRVIGVDIDKAILSQIESGNVNTTEPNLEPLLRKVLQNGNLKSSTTPVLADIYIIAVPTLLNSENQPDISAVEAAITSIKSLLQPHNLILIESTCPIGTTDLIAQNLQRICRDIQIAYCPERILPGNILHELIHNDRVVGGVDEISTTNAAAFYQSFIYGNVEITDARTAEAVKLVENAYRDINIAYANQLSMMADYLGLDTNKLIQLANKHPRVQILKPGVGVGGHCIAIDPWFLVASAPHLSSLILQARKVNLEKTNWIIQKIREAIKQNNSKRLTFLGLTYKPNVHDIRNSPALTIMEILSNEIEVIPVDPYVPNTQEVFNAISRADIVVSLVAHDAFLDISPNIFKEKVFLDFAGILQ